MLMWMIAKSIWILSSSKNDETVHVIVRKMITPEETSFTAWITIEWEVYLPVSSPNQYKINK